jgi:hypothetical protein
MELTMDADNRKKICNIEDATIFSQRLGFFDSILVASDIDR